MMTSAHGTCALLFNLNKGKPTILLSPATPFPEKKQMTDCCMFNFYFKGRKLKEKNIQAINIYK